MRIVPATVLMAILSVFAGCGDDAPEIPLEEGGSALGTQPRGVNPADLASTNPFDPKNVQEFELTDEVMETYFAAVKGMKAAKEAGASPLDVFNNSGIEPGQYQFIVKQFAMANAAAFGGDMRARTQLMLDQTEARIAATKAQFEAATGTQKTQLEAVLQGLEKQREQYVKMIERLPEDTPLRRKNMEVIERWLPKFRELTAK